MTEKHNSQAEEVRPTAGRLARIKLVKVPGRDQQLVQADRHLSLPSTDKHPQVPKTRLYSYLPVTDNHLHIAQVYASANLPHTDNRLPSVEERQHVTSARNRLEEIVARATQLISSWKAWLEAHASAVQGFGGLLIGIILLVLVLSYVNVSEILHTMQNSLTTPQGIFFALVASLALVTNFILRALRWRLFLMPVAPVSRAKAIQLFLVGVFLNFVLPVRIGEVAKCVLLKRIERVDVSRSLPTITIDKIFDLLPALVVVVIVPLLGTTLDGRLWTILFLVIGVLCVAASFIVLTAWKRLLALHLLQTMTCFLPGKLGTKIERFATSFVDALLASVRQPKTFMQATGLTILAVCCDGLYNMFAFWSLGYPASFGQSVLGFLLFNMFYILPNPPGQVGSNQVVGLLIFSGLLHIPPTTVTAMTLFFHAWSGLLMCAMGMGCLSALGVRLSQAMRMQGEKI